LLVLDIQGLCQTERNSQNKTILAKSSKHLLESWLKPSEMMQEQFSGDRHHTDDNDHMRKGKRVSRIQNCGYIVATISRRTAQGI
jgi:hypothetical protein